MRTWLAIVWLATLPACGFMLDTEGLVAGDDPAAPSRKKDGAVVLPSTGSLEAGSDSASAPGDNDATIDAGADSSQNDAATAGDAGPEAGPPACVTIHDCAEGMNCIARSCAPTLASCSALKTAHPSLGDGVYWIKPSTTNIRAYCDMALKLELCTEVEGNHIGKTREGSALNYAMRSILRHDLGRCEIWGVRASLDGRPFDRLSSGKTCAGLGFVEVPGKTDSLGICEYGTSRTDCGYPSINNWYRYGDHCVNCTLNGGTFTVWTKQGQMANAAVISDMSGGTRSFCAVGP